MTEIKFKRPTFFPKLDTALHAPLAPDGSPARVSIMERGTNTGGTSAGLAWTLEHAILAPPSVERQEFWILVGGIAVAKIGADRLRAAVPDRACFVDGGVDKIGWFLDTVMQTRIRFVDAQAFAKVDGRDWGPARTLYVDDADRIPAKAWVAVQQSLADGAPVRITGYATVAPCWFSDLAEAARQKRVADGAYVRITIEDAVAAGWYPTGAIAELRRKIPRERFDLLYMAKRPKPKKAA